MVPDAEVIAMTTVSTFENLILVYYYFNTSLIPIWGHGEER